MTATKPRTELLRRTAVLAILLAVLGFLAAQKVEGRCEHNTPAKDSLDWRLGVLGKRGGVAVAAL